MNHAFEVAEVNYPISITACSQSLKNFYGMSYFCLQQLIPYKTTQVGKNLEWTSQKLTEVRHEKFSVALTVKQQMHPTERANYRKCRSALGSLQSAGSLDKLTKLVGRFSRIFKYQDILENRLLSFQTLTSLFQLCRYACTHFVL